MPETIDPGSGGGAPSDVEIIGQGGGAAPPAGTSSIPVSVGAGTSEVNQSQPSPVQPVAQRNDPVRYDVVQDLTDEQKQRAQENLGLDSDATRVPIFNETQGITQYLKVSGASGSEVVSVANA